MRPQGVLALPAAYRAFGAVIGAAAARDTFVREHVRPRPGQRLLDIGCGPGDLVPHLTGVDYHGFDESAEYVEAARARYPGVHFSLERIEAHAVQPGRADLAIAMGVLHHLDDTGALQLLRLAHASLRAGGRLVTLDGCYVPGQNLVSRWLLSHDRGRHVRTQDEYLRLMGSVFSTVSAVVRTDLLRLPYTHCIVECTRG